MTPQAFSYYANGREPNYDTLIKIAAFFDVSVDYLLGVSNTQKPVNEIANKYTSKIIDDESINNETKELFVNIILLAYQELYASIVRMESEEQKK